MLSGLRSMPRLVDLGIGFAPPGRAFWAASAASLDRPFKPARTPCTPLRSALLFPAVAIAVTPPQSRRRHGGVTAAIAFPGRRFAFPGRRNRPRLNRGGRRAAGPLEGPGRPSLDMTIFDNCA